MQCVTQKNWTYSRYNQGKFRASITFGADPESLAEDRLEYYVTVLEDDQDEIFQQQFDSLSEACVFLNATYSDWEFEDQTLPKTGCSTCAAH